MAGENSGEACAGRIGIVTWAGDRRIYGILELPQGLDLRAAHKEFCAEWRLVPGNSYKRIWSKSWESCRRALEFVDYLVSRRGCKSVGVEEVLM